MKGTIPANRAAPDQVNSITKGRDGKERFRIGGKLAAAAAGDGSGR